MEEVECFSPPPPLSRPRRQICAFLFFPWGVLFRIGRVVVGNPVDRRQDSLFPSNRETISLSPFPFLYGGHRQTHLSFRVRRRAGTAIELFPRARPRPRPCLFFFLRQQMCRNDGGIDRGVFPLFFLPCSSRSSHRDDNRPPCLLFSFRDRRYETAMTRSGMASLFFSFRRPDCVERR